MRLKTLPIFLAFFLMGLADAMGPNSDKVKDSTRSATCMSTLLPFVGLHRLCRVQRARRSAGGAHRQEEAAAAGLGAQRGFAGDPVGPWCPVSGFCLGCIFLLGVGTTFLQVAGNPIMRDVSAEGKYSRNLAFAQGIKGIGSTASTYLLSAIAAIAFFRSMDWRAGFPFFCVLMILAFVSVLFLKVEETKVDVPPSIGSSLGLLKEPIFFLAVLGIFLYVGAEASMGTIPVARACRTSA